MGKYAWNSSSTPNYNSDNNKESNICRIFTDPNIKKTIVLDELSISDMGNNDPNNKTINNVGLSFPLICINNNIINSTELEYFEINCEKFIPSLYLKFLPKNENFIGKDVPKDGDIVSVFIKSSTDLLVPLRCDFIITSCILNRTIKSGKTSTGKITISGNLFVPGINSQSTSFAFQGTSKETLMEIAKTLGIGFATNDENNTNDKQLWICPKTNIETFVNDVTNHAWLDNESFYKTWIDLYYNLNFININKMLLSTDDEIDITGVTTISDFQHMIPIDTAQENAGAIPKLFSNFIENFKNTPFYIIKWEPINNATNVTNKIGSKINTHTFIHNQNIFNEGDDPYSSLENNQMYDPNKIDKYVILRGRSTYDKNTAAPDEMAHANIKTDDINTHNKWCGIQYTLSDEDIDKNDSNTWSGNVNINYNRSIHHNEINKRELDKMYIKVEVAGVCLQVMRGEKVPVFVNNTPGIQTAMDIYETGSPLSINKLYSGHYIVDGFKIIYKYLDNNNAGYSNFSTELTLKRREWPVPVNC